MNDQEEVQKSSGGGCLKVGLIGCGVLFLVALGIGIYVIVNIESIGVSAGHWVAVKGVESSELSDQDKKEIVAELDSLKAKYDAEEIDAEDLVKLFEELAQSPIMALGMVFYAQEQYIKPSGLSEAEKSEGVLTVNRFARGFVEKSISQQDMQATTASMFEENEQFKQSLEDEEIRTLLKDMKAAADAADVPMEEYTMDVAEEFRKAVKAAIGD